MAGITIEQGLSGSELGGGFRNIKVLIWVHLYCFNIQMGPQLLVKNQKNL